MSLIMGFVLCHYMFVVSVFSRVLALRPTKLWTKLFIRKRLRRTAWQAETSRLVNLHRTQDPVLIVLKRCLFENWITEAFYLFVLTFSLTFNQLLTFLLYFLVSPLTSSSGDDDKGTGSKFHVWPTSLRTSLSSNINVDFFLIYFILIVIQK